MEDFAMKKNIEKIFSTKEIDTKHIGILDGVRALSILLVAGFHFWQQSWLWNLNDSTKLKWLGIEDCGTNWLFSTGYIWVDMMILLTGLCLFLPYANIMVEERLGGMRQKLPNPGKFYLKRIARIWPSYYFCLAIMAVFFVRVSDYSNVSNYLRDLLSHLTFTHMFWKDTYLWTKFNGVLWTIGVEMAFYLIFPGLAYLFKKAPVATYLGMNACSLVYYLWVLKNHSDDLSMYINQFPMFLCVFANGMLAALAFVALAKNLGQNKYTGLFFTMLAIGSLYFMRIMIKYNLATSSNGQKWQIQNRFGLSLLFVSFIIGAGFSFDWFRAIFSNPVSRFVAKISFNLYICHQQVAIRLKAWKIPYWECESGYPQQDAGAEWQWKYTILCWLVSIIIAIAVTYLVEIPLHRLIMKLAVKKPKTDIETGE